MMTIEELEKIAREHQTPLFPNALREYFQHLFLQELYQLAGSEQMLFKGGTALRIIYGSPRFSEDLDFSFVREQHARSGATMERLFVEVLARIESIGVRVKLGTKSAATS